MPGEGGGDEGVKEVTAGETVEIVVQARDAYGNHRGVGEWRGDGGRGASGGLWVRVACALHAGEAGSTSRRLIFRSLNGHRVLSYVLL